MEMSPVYSDECKEKYGEPGSGMTILVKSKAQKEPRKPCEGCNDYMGFPCDGGWSCPGAF